MSVLTTGCGLYIATECILRNCGLSATRLAVVRDLFKVVSDTMSPSQPADCSNLRRRIHAALEMFYQHVPITEHRMMVHTIMHLVDCIEQLGPMHTYWMFPFERFRLCAIKLRMIGRLKRSVRN